VSVFAFKYGPNQIFFMANTYVLLPGISIFLVGLVFAWLFKRRFGVKLNIFFWGAAAWSFSIIIKLIVAFIFNATVYRALIFLPYGAYGYYVYIGLLTGIFEVFVPLFILKRKKNLFTQIKDQLGFGVGFGCFEAAMLGLVSIVLFLIFSTSSQNVLVAAAYNQSPSVYMQSAFYASVERLSAIAIHVFSNMLIFSYIFAKRSKNLVLAVVYMTFVDAMAAFFQLSPIVFTMMQVEAFFVVVALLSLIAVREMLKGRIPARKISRRTKGKKR
jgi:uncharacterized membrane protein YhfC